MISPEALEKARGLVANYGSDPDGLLVGAIAAALQTAAAAPKLPDDLAGLVRLLKALATDHEAELSNLKKQVEELTKALGPFANFAEEQVFIAENMWLDGAQRERIGDWFGPTAFADAYRATRRMLFAQQGKIIGERNDKNR